MMAALEQARFRAVHFGSYVTLIVNRAARTPAGPIAGVSATGDADRQLIMATARSVNAVLKTGLRALAGPVTFPRAWLQIA
jgi:hypothetical protein